MLAVTALDVAFVTALAAIAAPLTAYLVARTTNRHRRWEIIHTTSYADRRDALLKLLRDVESGRKIAHDLAEAFEHNDPSLAAHELEPPSSKEMIDQVATADAYATDEMRSAIEAYIDAYNEKLYSAIDAAGHETEAERQQGAANIREGLKATRAERDRLRNVIRDDLRG